MDKSKEFLKNTIVIFIGKFSTQFVALLLLPIFTYYLTASDYGMVDLIQTYIMLFVPLLTLRLDSVAFRFLIDTRSDKEAEKKANTNIMVCLAAQCIVSLVITGILAIFLNFQYFILAIFSTVAMMISSVLLQAVRGMGNNPVYSKASIIAAVSTLVVNLVLIIALKWGADSILIASIVANLLCSIYIFMKNKIYSKVKLELLDKKLIKEMLAYSLPMVPNSFSWWLVNVSNRTIIVWLINTTANGIYAVSCKFSSIINSIFAIINMSWQETASVHINDKDASEFFSKTINYILGISISVSIFLIAILPFAFSILIGDEFAEAYQYIPILLVSDIFNILIGLIGGIYVAKKMTKEIAKTTFLSGIIGLVLNLILVKRLGIYAIAISTLIAYGVVAIHRYIDVQKYIKIKISGAMVLFFGIGILVTIPLYYYNQFWTNCASIMVTIILIMVFNRTLIKNGYNMAIGGVKGLIRKPE